MQSLEIDQTQQRPSTTTSGSGTSGSGNYKSISDPSLLPKNKSNITGACSNLVNSIVGAGIIGIPYALKESGLVSGIILLVAVGYFTNKSLQMIVDLATSSRQLKGKGVWTYNDLMELPYGRSGKNFVLISMFITAYGAMVAYLLIIKDTLPVILGLVNDADETVGGFVERELVMIITSLFVCVPLSMQRDFSSLAFTSSVSVFADILLVIFVAIFAPIGESVQNAGGLGAVISSSIINSGFFIGFGVLTVAMCCQHSAFIVASSLNNPNPKRWSIVTSISLTLSVICCLVLGVSGYLGFLEDTSGDVLNNFGVGKQANIARGLLALTMFFTYPMEAFVARHVLVELIWGGDMNGYTIHSVIDEETGEEIITQKKSKCFCGILNRRHQVTLLIYILTLIPALIVEDLGPVLSITGAIGGCSLAYIGPGLAYLGIYGDDLLQRCANIILSMNTTKTKTDEAELPIDGDATAQMDDNNNNNNNNNSLNNVDPRLVFSKDYMKGYSKPYWWYPLGMPIWISIALKGSNGLNERLTELESDQYRSSSPVSNIINNNNNNTDDSSSPPNNNENENGGNGSTAVTTTNDGDSSSTTTTTNVNATVITTTGEDETSCTVEPCIIDYGFAIFFIVFGSIALIAGVASNVYVQIHGIYIAQ
jgi:sodium-coupled neutral amino acid transporter 11